MMNVRGSGTRGKFKSFPGILETSKKGALPPFFSPTAIEMEPGRGGSHQGHLRPTLLSEFLDSLFYFDCSVLAEEFSSFGS